MKHTPGPWTYEKPCDRAFFSSPTGLVFISDDECIIEEADAQLIAVSPEMYSLLLEAVEFSDKAKKGNTQDCDGYSMLAFYEQVFIPRAKALIAKAENK